MDREPQRNAEVMRKTDEESNATAGAERTTERSCNDAEHTQEPAKPIADRVHEHASRSDT